MDALLRQLLARGQVHLESVQPFVAAKFGARGIQRSPWSQIDLPLAEMSTKLIGPAGCSICSRRQTKPVSKTLGRRA